MGWLIRALSSSVGQKFVMGITGLLLCGFLVTHLAGNFLLFAGADAYNEYAHALHEQAALLAVAEVGLFGLFAAHLALAVITTRNNQKARAKSYEMVDSKQQGVSMLPIPANTFMFASGAVVLAFVLWHLADMRVQLRPDLDYSGKEPFDISLMVLTNPMSRIVYLIGCIALGVHLSHGFSSAFQSLGLNHPRWAPIIKTAGIAFAVAIAAGFISCVVWAMAA